MGAASSIWRHIEAEQWGAGSSRSVNRRGEAAGKAKSAIRSRCAPATRFRQRSVIAP
jgi:hypothetical protein